VPSISAAFKGRLGLVPHNLCVPTGLRRIETAMGPSKNTNPAIAGIKQTN
jgi:hypothetical protein